MNTKTSNKHRLVTRIRDEYFSEWFKPERQSLEEEWSLSYDAFRGKYDSANLKKWKALEGMQWRSKVFVRVTKVKVVSTYAQIRDIYFQGGQIPFTIEPTEIPEDMSGAFLDPKMAEERSKKMQTKIEDVFDNSKPPAKKLLSDAILERCIYGVSVLESPVIKEKVDRKYIYRAPRIADFSDMILGTNLSQKYGRHEQVLITKLMPMINHPNIWDMFWDLESSDPQDGQGIIHRVRMSPGQLNRLAQFEQYDKEAIRLVIEKAKDDSNGASESSEGPARNDLQRRKRNIEVLSFCGRVPAADLSNTQMDESKDLGKEVEIKCVIANDEIIMQPFENPYPDGKRPYHFAYLEKIPHESNGIGIPENLRDAQMMINSATRCFIDNKALSANVVLAGNSKALAPGQNKSLTPGKWFELADHVVDARQALQSIIIPDVGDGLLDLINLFERFADEESGQPKIMQGETSRNDPKTAYAFSRLIENANKQIGQMIANTDEGHTEPIVTGLYHWLMATSTDEDIKGDFTCKATGFTGFNDIIVDGQNIQNFLMFLLSNEMTAQFAKVLPGLREIAKKRNIEPDMILKTDEEMQAEMEMLTQQAEVLRQAQGVPGQLSEEGAPISLEGEMV